MEEQLKKYTAISEIIADNEKIGKYFFSPNTMKHFRTRLHYEVYYGIMFIISDKRESSKPRYFKICICKNGIVSYMNSTDYPTKKQAIKALHEYAKKEGLHENN